MAGLRHWELLRLVAVGHTTAQIGCWLGVTDAPVLANAFGDDGSDGQRARAEFRDAGDVAAPDT